MRGVKTVIAAVVLVVAGIGGPAAAREPALAPPGSTASAGPGQTLCTVDNPRALELSGLVSTDNGYVAINDSNDNPDLIRIFFIDRACKVTRTIGYPTAARDPEDLAQAPDGTLWVADIGDNYTNAADNRRATIALWKLAPGATTPVIHRLTYPDGPHDAEALILDGAGTPVIVTKDPLRPAGVYVPSGPLQPGAGTGVALKKVGTFAPSGTGTSNFLGAIGQFVVTGGANSPDGRRVALRTYSDAYEWDVSGGDVVKAITTGVPRITALPDEPQGESIAYTRDGASFLTVSDENGPTMLQRYTPVRPKPATKPSKEASGGTRPDSARLSGLQFLSIVGVVALFGGVLVMVGVVGRRRSRRARRRAASRQAPPGPARGRARVNGS